MSETTQKFKQQLPKNVAMAVVSFITYALIAIWLTPYLVSHLGTAAYGLVPLAGLFTQYVAIITAQISRAVNRFLTIEIQKPDGDPNVVFNSSLALYLILIVIQLPLFAIGVFYADRIFSIPPELKPDALLLLGFSAGSFMISLLGAVFGVSIYSKNRLDIGHLMEMARLIFRLLLIVAVFSLRGPKLRYIGYIDFALNVVLLGAGIVIWKKITPQLHISFRQIEWRVLGPVFHMSLWSLLNQLGSLLYLRTDIWIINRFISPVVAGQYAAILVVSNFIRKLANLGNGQIGPVTMSYWAKGERGELRRMLSFSVKLFSFGLALPIALLCANANHILRMWLGEGFSDCSLLFTVLTIHLCINTSVYPLFHLFAASNSVRIPALVTFFMGIVNVTASYLLGVSAGMGALGVALATAIVLSLKNAFFTPIYSARILKLSAWSFMGPLLGSIPVMGLAYLLTLMPVAEWFLLGAGTLAGMILQAAWVCLIAGLCGWWIIFSKTERRTILETVRGKLRLMRSTRAALG